MDTITFHCKTVTPLVMNGAYGNNDPELRPPGIKASLRFWWRALHGHLSLVQLREQEAAIFGSTKGRSKVIIRVDTSLPNEFNDKTYLLPHRTDSERAKSPVAAYVPNLSFKIRIDCPFAHTEMIKNLFILVCTLGGWGKRSRRGFGAIAVSEIEVNGSANENFKMPETLDDILEYMNKAYFEKVHNTINSNFRRNEPYPFLNSIEIGEGFNDFREALKSIGSSSSASKREQNDSLDYRNSLGHTSKRFASPYYVSIIQKGDKFHPIFTSLNIATERGNNAPLSASEIQKSFKNRINEKI